MKKSFKTIIVILVFIGCLIFALQKILKKTNFTKSRTQKEQGKEYTLDNKIERPDNKKKSKDAEFTQPAFNTKFSSKPQVDIKGIKGSADFKTPKSFNTLESGISAIPKMELQPAGDISGTVVLEDSLFNEGVTVSLEKTDYSTSTDEKGRFSFKGLPVGTYTLVARFNEYHPERDENIIVHDKQVVKLPKIILKPDFDVAYPKIIRTKPERNAKNVDVPNNFNLKGFNINKHTGFCICLDFSKPMNKESVEKSIGIEPVLSYTFQWIDNRRLVIKTDTAFSHNPLKLNTDYRISFIGDVLAIDDKRMLLEDKTTIEFSTGAFKVVATEPKNDSNDHLPTNKVMQFYFNAPVDKATLTDSTFLISPPMSGKISFSDTDKNYMLYLCSRNLRTNTRWTIVMKKDVRDINNNNLAEDFVLSFQTAPFKIVNTWPNDKQNNVSTSGFPYILFNTEVDKGSFKKAFLISPEVKGEFTWNAEYDGREYCIFKHNDFLFNSNTIYTITISDEVMDAFGNKMNEPYKFSFKTEGARVSYTTPLEGSTGIDKKGEIAIVFNTLMNREETVRHVLITPKEDILLHWGSQHNYDILGIEPKDGWKPNTAYTIKVGKEAKDIKGDVLIKEFNGTYMTR